MKNEEGRILWNMLENMFSFIRSMLKRWEAYSLKRSALMRLFVERLMRLYVETMAIALQRWSFELDMLSWPNKIAISVGEDSSCLFALSIRRRGLSFPDFSRRLSVSLTTFVDAFIESSLKVFTLPSFPSWYCLHLRKDGQAGFRAFLFGKNACPSMGHSFLPVFRSDGLSYHPDFFVWPGKDIPLFPIVHSFFLYILFFHIFFCTPVSICAKAGTLYPMLMCGLLLL